MNGCSREYVAMVDERSSQGQLVDQAMPGWLAEEARTVSVLVDPGHGTYCKRCSSPRRIGWSFSGWSGAAASPTTASNYPGWGCNKTKKSCNSIMLNREHLGVHGSDTQYTRRADNRVNVGATRGAVGKHDGGWRSWKASGVTRGAMKALGMTVLHTSGVTRCGGGW